MSAFGFDTNCKRLKILIVSDVDIASASRLAEFFVPKPPQFDCCIVCGPFTHTEIISREDESTSEGDMASTIAQLENIVCRVVYLPSDKDPVTSLADQLHLTPNSICIHSRIMPLTDGLYIAGFTEKTETLSVTQGAGSSVEAMDDADDSMDGVEVSASSSIGIIHDVLSGIQSAVTDEQHHISNSTLFVLNYRYAHTLNSFLFHSSKAIEDAGLQLCIIPAALQSGLNVPQKVGQILIASPESLRLGHYQVLDMELMHVEGGRGAKWTVTSIHSGNLSLESI